ncbi:zinc-ribbon domain-containing protein [Paenarthrobacter sp. C1]|uniref:zinc-ribbon domain-containing protein n=1 Tax=Paenarthrobacter sp. C1 TaxID=3400220 RepID=UPI003BF5E6DE
MNTTAKRQRPATARPMTPAPGQSLAEKFPAFAAEWDTTANGDLTPNDVSYGSDRAVSWLCPNGHPPYIKKVCYRTSRNRGCPVCGRAKLDAPKKGKSLADAFPDIAAEWDYEKNHPLTPADVAPRSNKKAYFICPKGHGSTESYISNRTAGNGCPECGRQRGGQANTARAIARGTLAEVNPSLAAEWNTELNDFTPGDVSPGSPRAAWWNCPAGHEPYLSQVARRHSGQGCPVCANIRRAAAISYKGPKPGTTLADKRPDLIPAWDMERNTLTPADVSPSSHKVVHWICPDGHRFERTVIRRAASNICPVERDERRAARAA